MAAAVPAFRSGEPVRGDSVLTRAAEAAPPGRAPVAPEPPPPADGLETEGALYRSAAEAAWGYLRAQRTVNGMVKATEHYDHITTWDLGSLFLGVHAAGALGVSPPGEAEAWLETLLGTLAGMPLFGGALPNKSYSATSGLMIGWGDEPSDQGRGWSATDLGRLLVALKVIEVHHPDLAGAARAVVERMDLEQVVEGGYLHGEEALEKRSGTSRYPEGRVGYEQYAAHGFRLWGQVAEAALDPMRNGVPVEVMGHTLLSDRRGRDKLTSEPFVLMGMELGWTPPFRDLAWRMLAVQEARYHETGQVTMVSEDAIQRPPHYFYYYSVFSEGEPFVVRAHGPVEDGPRWVSAKAAYAWHSLLPTEYTWLAVNAVEPARSRAGWASGVFEGSGESTGVRNLNTAAIILEAALHREMGRPLLEDGRVAWRE